MSYIVIGFILVALVVILLLLDKFAPYSAIMSDFTDKSFKRLLIGLSTASVLAFGYGIYYEITYQPPFLDIYTSEGQYTVFGEIGEMGYYADRLAREDREIELHVVSWEELNLPKEATITVEYPSGKEENWTTSITLIDDEHTDRLEKNHDIQEIYKLEPYTFTEAGEVELHIGDRVTVEIEVKRK